MQIVEYLLGACIIARYLTERLFRSKICMLIAIYGTR